MKSRHSAGYETFQLALITARKDAGLTQAELADRLNKPQSFVSKYEAGERRLDVVEFLVVAKAINADPHHLLRQIAIESELSKG